MKYKVLHDVTIPSQNGRTTQIDNVVFSEYGIFVIEVKNYQGWIVGKEHDEYCHKLENNVCPKCNSPLVQRRGKFGAFIGCSGYPKCRFIAK